MTNDKELIIPRQFGFSTCLAKISAELSKTYKQLWIAIEALEVYKEEADVNNRIAVDALNKIKELEK